MEAIRIASVFIKQTSGRPVRQVPSIALHAGLGIEEDIHASPVSPRQVLVTRQEDLDELNILPGGLRENIVICGSTEKAFRPGALIAVNGVAIRLCFYCEACKRISDVVPNLAAVYRKRGILGMVQHGGIIHTGDAGHLVANRFPALPEEPVARFRMLLDKVPYGKVIDYQTMLLGMGVAPGYMRAMPQYIKTTDPHRHPLHRIVDSKKALIEKYIPDQRSRLLGEGIVFHGSDIVPGDFLWQPASLFAW